MLARIALFSPPYSTLTYTLPEEFPEAFWLPGLRVAVPLGGKAGSPGSLRAGMLLARTDDDDLPQGVVCKPVAWPLESAPIVPPDLLALAQDLALRQGLSAGQTLGHMLPQGLRSTRVRLRLLDDTARGGRTLGLREAAFAPTEERRRLADALLSGTARLIPAGDNPADAERCILRAEPPWPVRPAALRQREVLDYLLEHGSVSRRRLLQALGRQAAPALASLLAAGHVALQHDGGMEEEAGLDLLPPAPAPYTLNADQQRVLEDLVAAADTDTAAARLLFGVTGSGKTAVYLALARHCLNRGKSVFLLAPEVALALKLHRDASCLLPDVPLFLSHGYQTPARRDATFRALAARRDPCLIIGTRSALFLPVPNPGCVILDEEHDASYKQDEGMPYHAKEVAWFRMTHTGSPNGGLLLLGSATPDIQTFYAARQGSLPLLRLPQRVGARPLPEVELVDICGMAPAAEAEGLLAPRCEEALRETLARGEQAVVLLNRRGYAPLIYCLDCKATLKCPHCQIGLTYHKGRERLLCHYCGYSVPFPLPCPACHGINYLPMGEGTERLAERLSVLAGRPVLRLDRDSTRRPGRMEEILEAFARQESPILVGTQMLSKGHHFPLVTLAVVADGDLGLNLPDYRAAERSFQLLVQSAGRAGRGERPGRVLIQTRDPGHYCWKYVPAADYEGFYEEEIARREKFAYPPFSRLALIRLSHEMQDAGGAAALKTLAGVLRQEAAARQVRLLGPAPAPLAVLRGRKRYYCLLKGQDWTPLRQIYFAALAAPESKYLRIFLDLNPINML